MKEEDYFNFWNKKKKCIHEKNSYPYFKTGEIWWAILGKNIASEIAGKGEDFLRPILVFKRVYTNSLIAIPLSTKIKNGSYYFTFKDSNNLKQCAILSQIRYLDGKRLAYKKSKIKSQDYDHLLDKFIRLIKK